MAVSNYFPHYCRLVSSVEQLEYCRRSQSLGELLASIKELWNCSELDDIALLGEINRCNQMPVGIETSLVCQWLPYRYQPKSRLVNWLIPVGHATEPFQDEYISRCRQKLVNQIIQPCTSLECAHQQAKCLPDVEPAGFIFHLSRCGSTLVSGCLSELASTCVFSESPLLTELLLDEDLSSTEQHVFLKSFINMQASAFPNRPQMIIKWNAWDIFRWTLIREVYANIPIIFLVREPIEILASHHKFAGRHMSGDRSLSILNSVFIGKGQALLSFRCAVLAALLGEMNKFSNDSYVLRVDYRQLDAEEIRKIIDHFCLFIDSQSFQSITRRLQFHSKIPDATFSDDTHVKQTLFSIDDKATIEHFLQLSYATFFLDGKPESFEKTIA